MEWVGKVFRFTVDGLSFHAPDETKEANNQTKMLFVKKNKTDITAKNYNLDVTSNAVCARCSNMPFTHKLLSVHFHNEVQVVQCTVRSPSKSRTSNHL